MGAYTLLQDLTVSTNSTSVVLNDFGTITKDDFVKVMITHINGSASTSNARLLANNSTNANYHTQTLNGAGSGVSALRINENRIARTTLSQTSSSIVYLKLSQNDRVNYFSNNTTRNDSVLTNTFAYVTSSGATFTSGITSLTLQTEINNAIGTGSRIQIYKLAAVKVEEITVASNTTQVDISSLSIDKDSEYLLVSDIVKTVSAQSTYFLTPNDATTIANYHTQALIGLDSSAIASRSNDPRYSFTSSDTFRALTYTHIKLSNIGAYTHQSYGLLNYGTSSMFLHNFFTSSTTENITSITKLNIRAQQTNAIGAGSRFTLYKLYE